MKLARLPDPGDERSVREIIAAPTGSKAGVGDRPVVAHTCSPPLSLHVADDARTATCVLHREKRRLNLLVGSRSARRHTAIVSARRADGRGQLCTRRERPVADRKTLVGHADLQWPGLSCAAA